MYETILYSLEDGVLTITLNRPDRRNAFNGPMIDELIAAFDRADADDAVRVIIVTGAGSTFSAGADLEAGAATFDIGARTDGDSPIGKDGKANYSHPMVEDAGGKIALRIFRSLKPVIGAINGAAVGLGVTLTLPMDIRVASNDARFGFVFTRRGIVPEAASTFFLPRIVGISRAAEWCISGRLLSADEAKEGGLIRSVYSREELLPAAKELALDIARNTAPVSVALTRQMLWRSLGADGPFEAHRLGSRGVFARGRSADAREGVASFLEKRAPVYPDRVSADMPDYYPWFDDPSYR
jgi:enoyl-CoA hydratase/carnithine racemase